MDAKRSGGRGTRIVAAVQGALRAPRPAEKALAAAVLFAAFLYLPLRLTFGRAGGAGMELGTGAPPPVQLADVDPEGDLTVPTPPYVAAAGAERERKRNLFAYGKKPTPPPTPTPAPTPPPPPTPTPRPPTPTPTPYNPALTVIGIVVEQPSARRIAFLKSGEEMFVCLEGDVIAVKAADGRVQRHKIQKIGIETVDIGPVDFEASLKLKMGS